MPLFQHLLYWQCASTLFCSANSFSTLAQVLELILRTDIFLSLKIMLYNIPAAKDHKF